MNILKIKSILFSLMAIAMVTVFLSSCEKESIQTNKLTNFERQDGSKGIMLPQEADNYDNEAIKSYIESLSSSEIAKYSNEYTTMQFLEKKGKLSDISSDILESGSISNVNLSNHLSETENEELRNQFISAESSEINERGCWAIYRYCGSGYYCFCCIICI